MTDLRAWIRSWFSTTSGAAIGPSGPDAPPRRLASTTFTEAHNDFALALGGRILRAPGNLVFSPLSVRVALAMAYAGARGETAEQMSRALRFAPSEASQHADLAGIIRDLTRATGGGHQLLVTSSLWIQKGAPLLTPFLDTVAQYGDGGPNHVDFRGDAEAARRTINRWIDGATKQRIRELVAPGGVDADTRLVLVNAVHLKGAWELKFSREATRDEAFYLEGGRKVRTPLMYQQRTVRYVQARGYQAVELDYKGGDLAMLVLLPDDRNGLADLEKRLSEPMLQDCTAQMLSRAVDLFLPRFKLTWGAVELRDHLRELGMPLALTRGQADLSGIDGCAPPSEDSLFISGVVHEAFIDMNEEGTEAAAATAVLVPMCAAMAPSKPPPVPVFRADHPFLFAIRDRKSGVILFLGRLADPWKER